MNVRTRVESVYRIFAAVLLVYSMAFFTGALLFYIFDKVPLYPILVSTIWLVPVMVGSGVFYDSTFVTEAAISNHRCEVAWSDISSVHFYGFRGSDIFDIITFEGKEGRVSVLLALVPDRLKFLSDLEKYLPWSDFSYSMKGELQTPNNVRPLR